MENKTKARCQLQNGYENKTNKNVERKGEKEKKERIYTYTYTPVSKIKTVQQKLSTLDWPGEQRKPKIISTRIKLIKAQTGKQN